VTGDSDAPTITLRSATTADEPAIHRLTEQLAAFPIPPWRTPGEIARADHAMLAEALRVPRADTLVLLAENPEGLVVGVLFVSTRADYFTGSPHAHVEVLALDPAAQGQGLGRRLMQEAERWARERDYGAITLNVFDGNARALGLYERLGYRTETRHLWKAL
jgi:ribosomal protein S18 acetylase RimI-like enzyme